MTALGLDEERLRRKGLLNRYKNGRIRAAAGKETGAFGVSKSLEESVQAVGRIFLSKEALRWEIPVPPESSRAQRGEAAVPLPWTE